MTEVNGASPNGLMSVVPVMTGGPIEERDTESFTFRWPATGFGMILGALHEGREGIEGEVQVFCDIDGRRVLVHGGRLRLLGTNSKRDLARLLGEQTKSIGRNGVPFDWKIYVEIACHRTIQMYREGEPILELADVEAAPQRYLIAGLIPEARTTLLIGDGSSTKSIQSLAMSLAVVLGRKIGPYSPLRQGPVLYADAETDAEEQSERLSRICASIGVGQVPRGLYYQPQMRPLVQSKAALRQAIKRTGAVMVVLDSAGALAHGSLNDDDVVIPMTNALRTLGSDVTRLLVSHVSKQTAGQAGGRGRALGSVYMENYARSILEARREGNSATDFLVGLYHRKVNRGPLQDAFAVRMRFEDPMGPIRLTSAAISDSPDLAAYGQDADVIVAALAQAGGTLDFPTLQEETGMKESTLRRRLKAMPQVTEVSAGKSGRGNVALFGLVDWLHTVPAGAAK